MLQWILGCCAAPRGMGDDGRPQEQACTCDTAAHPAGRAFCCLTLETEKGGAELWVRQATALEEGDRSSTTASC